MTINHMQEIFDNLINGNISDAKQAAKKHSWRALYMHARWEMHRSEECARATADFLTDKGSYQSLCDAEHKESRRP